MDTLRLGQQNTMLDVVRQLRQMDQVLDRITSADVPNYEEGTWTPGFSPLTGSYTSITYTTRVGQYTRIGNVVFAWAQITVNAVNTAGGSNALRVNLPMNASNERTIEGSVARMANFALATASTNLRVTGEGVAHVRFDVHNSNAATVTSVTATEIKAATLVDFITIYRV